MSHNHKIRTRKSRNTSASRCSLVLLTAVMLLIAACGGGETDITFSTDQTAISSETTVSITEPPAENTSTGATVAETPVSSIQSTTSTQYIPADTTTLPTDEEDPFGFFSECYISILTDLISMSDEPASLLAWVNQSIHDCESTEEWKQTLRQLFEEPVPDQQPLTEEDIQIQFSALYIKCLEAPDAAACSDVNVDNICFGTLMNSLVGLSYRTGNPETFEEGFQAGMNLTDEEQQEIADIMMVGLSDCGNPDSWDNALSWVMDTSDMAGFAPELIPTAARICELSVSDVCDLIQ